MISIVGSWSLIDWTRIRSDGLSVLPLGQDASGVLIYAPDGTMASQIISAGRASIDSSDPISGPAEQCAGAYCSCLAYFGTYKVGHDQVEHTITASLYPNWSGKTVSRTYTLHDDTLVLTTLPVEDNGLTVINQMRWRRSPSLH